MPFPARRRPDSRVGLVTRKQYSSSIGLAAGSISGLARFHLLGHTLLKNLPQFPDADAEINPTVPRSGYKKRPSPPTLNKSRPSKPKARHLGVPYLLSY